MRDGEEHIHLPDFILFDQVGPVEAERFFYILNRDNFDYTEWQKGLFADEIWDVAAETYRRNRGMDNSHVFVAG